MKNKLLSSFSEGFKNSFRLSSSLVTSVAGAIAAFAHPDRANDLAISDKQQRGGRGPVDSPRPLKKHRKR